MRKGLKSVFNKIFLEEGEELSYVSLLRLTIGIVVGVTTTMAVFYTRVSAIPDMQVDIVGLKSEKAVAKADTENFRIALNKMDNKLEYIAQKQDRMYELMIGPSRRKP